MPDRLPVEPRVRALPAPQRNPLFRRSSLAHLQHPLRPPPHQLLLLLLRQPPQLQPLPRPQHRPAQPPKRPPLRPRPQVLAPATTRSRRRRECRVPADPAPATTPSRRLRACPDPVLLDPAHPVRALLVPAYPPVALVVLADPVAPTRPSRHVPVALALVLQVLVSSAPVAALPALVLVLVAPVAPVVAPVVPVVDAVVTLLAPLVVAVERARLVSRSGRSVKSSKCARPRRLVA